MVFPTLRERERDNSTTREEVSIYSMASTDDDELPATISYVPEITPWVQAVSDFFTAKVPDTKVAVVSPNCYEEVGLRSVEHFELLMYPSIGKGSLKRFVIRVTTPNNLDPSYFLVKEVVQELGRREALVGTTLRRVATYPSFIPALFGVDAEAYGIPRQPVHYVVVPWMKDLITLTSFWRNGFAEKHQLTTLQILKAISPLLKDMFQAHNDAALIHLDLHPGQVVVGVNPLRLFLIDFGLARLVATVDGNTVTVNPRQLSHSSKTYADVTASFLKETLHDKLVLANKLGRDEVLKDAWLKYVQAFAKNRIGLDTIVAWINSL